MSAISFLTTRWEKTLALVKPPKLSPSISHHLLSDIICAYSESHRHYHTVDHLAYSFAALDEEMAKLPGTGAVELALWYHDFVYDTKSKDSEERSAAVAHSSLIRMGFTEEYAQQVEALILATKHVAEPGTREAKVLLDVDIAILGAPAEEYDVYEQNIRKEYAWVPEANYRAGRTKVLEGFLSRQWVYSTPDFRNGPREGMARSNLVRALALL